MIRFICKNQFNSVRAQIANESTMEIQQQRCFRNASGFLWQYGKKSIFDAFNELFVETNWKHET